jgi:hypothetical protein
LKKKYWSIYMDNDKLEQYGNVYSKIGWEGGTGIFSYGNPGCDFDPELNEAFEKAQAAVDAFENMLESKIEALGGSTEDFEV